LGDADLGPKVSNLSSFGQDASGHLWAADVGGPVYRLDSDGNAATTPTCPGGPTTTPPAPSRDTTPAKLKISRARKQHVLKTHYIKITVSPNELAPITARGRVKVPGAAKLFRTHASSRRCLAGKKVSLRLRLSKRTLGRIRRALRHRKFLSATITITSRDASGNLSKPRHTGVRLVR
jgi:hypothetical protein